MLAVVLCTYERPGPLAAALADILRQAPPDAEIVLVDQSTPATAAEIERLAARSGVRYLRLAEPGLPAARDAGVRATTAPMIVFLDDDVRLLPGCLAAHLRAYDDPRVGGTVGRIIERTVRPNTPGTDNRIGPGGRVHTNLWGTEPMPIATLKGANMTIRRDALGLVGGFDPRYRGTALLEEADVSERLRRAGFALRYVPEAELVHLSAAAGGVRVGSAHQTERWRFHNTAYFLRRHRGRVGSLRGLATFTAIAVGRAVRWRDPRAPISLMRAFHDGWALAAGGR